MPKQHVSRATLPPELRPLIKRLGERIAVARRRRGWRSVDLARKIGISPPTMVRIERGEPTVSFGAYASALWALGLTDDLAALGDPTRDSAGMRHDLARIPERVRPPKLDNDF